MENLTGSVLPGALHGVRIIDLTSVIMGPLATQILGDLGADVVTFEAAGGETNRFMSDGPHPQLSGIALNILRNKRNVSIDLKREAGREVMLRAVAQADVFVTNLRPAALARLGLTYDDVRAVRPDVVFCQAAGFASDSPSANEPAYDDVVQAATGIADAARIQTGVPALAPTILADKVCALAIAYAVLAALFHRERTGQGQRVEVPMVDVMTSFMLVEHGAAAIAKPSDAAAGYARILTANRRPQRTADGWVHILPYSADHYDRLFAHGGRPDLVGDTRYQDARARVENADFLYGQVHELTPAKTTEEWLSLCREHGIPAAKMGTLDDLVHALPEMEHPVAGRYKSIRPPVRFDATPATVRRYAPLPGEHNVEILSEIGYSSEEIAALDAAKVLRGRFRATKPVQATHD